MLLMLFEPLLMNTLNLDMALKLNGVVDVSRLMMEQPMPSEVPGFEYNKKFVNTSFKHTLRCLCSCMRQERGVIEFVTNPKWLNRLLQILEEWKEEEIIVICAKTLRLVLRSEVTYDRVAEQYPNMGTFMLILMSQYIESEHII